MHSLSSSVPDRPRGSEAELRMVQAYKSVFTGRATQEDCELVLSDLAHHTGFFRSLGPGRSHDERAFDDGRRWVMARILDFTERSGRALAELQDAAAREHSVDYPVRRTESLDGDYV